MNTGFPTITRTWQMRAVTISILAVLCGLFAQETTATESSSSAASLEILEIAEFMSNIKKNSSDTAAASVNHEGNAVMEKTDEENCKDDKAPADTSTKPRGSRKFDPKDMGKMIEPFSRKFDPKDMGEMCVPFSRKLDPKDIYKLDEPFDSFVVTMLKEAHAKGENLMPGKMYPLLEKSYRHEFETMPKRHLPSKWKFRKRFYVIKKTHLSSDSDPTESCLSSSAASPEILELSSPDFVWLRHDIAEAFTSSDGAFSKLSSMIQKSESSSERRGIGRDILALLVLDDAIRKDRQDVISWLFQGSIVNDASRLLWHYINENDEAMVDRILKFPELTIAKANDGSATPTRTKLYDLRMHNGQELQVAIRKNNLKLVNHLVIDHHASLELARDDAARNNDGLVLTWIVRMLLQRNKEQNNAAKTGYSSDTDPEKELMSNMNMNSSDTDAASEDHEGKSIGDDAAATTSAAAAADQDHAAEPESMLRQEKKAGGDVSDGGVAATETEAQELLTENERAKLVQLLKEEFMKQLYQLMEERLRRVPEGSRKYAIWPEDAREQIVNLGRPRSDDDNAIVGDVKNDAVMEMTHEDNCKDDNGGRRKHLHEHGDQNGADWSGLLLTDDDDGIDEFEIGVRNDEAEHPQRRGPKRAHSERTKATINEDDSASHDGRAKRRRRRIRGGLEREESGAVVSGPRKEARFEISEEKEFVGKPPNTTMMNRDEFHNAIVVTKESVVEKRTLELYLSEKMPRDGDCAFHCLEISRKDAVSRLLENAHVDKVRALMAPEIAEAFIESSLPSQVNDLHELAEFVPHRKDKKASFDKELYERLKMACTSEAVFVAYVKAEVATPGKLLGSLLPVDRRHLTSSIDAIAYLLGRNVQIYRLETESERVLVVSEVHWYRHNKEWPLLKLLHTNKGTTHFDLLNRMDLKTYKIGQSLVEEVREQIVNMDFLV